RGASHAMSGTADRRWTIRAATLRRLFSACRAPAAAKAVKSAANPPPGTAGDASWPLSPRFAPAVPNPPLLARPPTRQPPRTRAIRGPAVQTGAGGPLPRARIARSAQRKSVRRGSGRGPAQHAQRAVAVVFHADQHQLVLLPLTSLPRFFGRRARLDLVAEREPLAARPAPRLQLRHLFLRTADQRTL